MSDKGLVYNGITYRKGDVVICTGPVWFGNERRIHTPIGTEGTIIDLGSRSNTVQVRFNNGDTFYMRCGINIRHPAPAPAPAWIPRKRKLSL